MPKSNDEIIAAATKGPWGRFRDGLDTMGGPIFLFSDESDREQGRADAEFMARAREQWPAAIAEIESYKREIKHWYGKLEGADAEVEALSRCVSRWQKGDLIESDFVAEDGSMVKDPYAEIERLRKGLEMIRDMPTSEARDDFQKGLSHAAGVAIGFLND